jgi:hypothetical protein
MSILTPDKDKFGFYEVGNQKTYSKLEALEFKKATGLPINWNFNDRVFENFDWSVEPPESLEFYYAQRVRQLREKYDYLVLMYSGGADSAGILDTFVENNVFVDEICQYHNLQGEGGNKNSWMNEEVFHNSAPQTQELIASNPVYKNTVHRLIDITALQQNILKVNDNKFDVWYKTNGYHTPNTLARVHLRELPEYQKIINSGKTLCFIWGVEKPTVSGDADGNYWITFTDARDGQGVAAATQMLNREWEHDEYFFWTPDLPEIPCKQGHIVKQFLEKLVPDHIDNRYVYYGPRAYDEYGRSFASDKHVGTRKHGTNTYYLLLYGLNTLIYKNYNPELVVCGKPISTMISPRDSWFFKSNSADMNQSMYLSGMLHFRNLVKSIDSSMWWEFKYDPKISNYSGGIQPMTKKYLLGTGAKK